MTSTFTFGGQEVKMDTPNGLNPVVLDFQVEQKTIPIQTGRNRYSNVLSTMTCKALIETRKPMVMGEKYPPLLDITVGGRRANLYGITCIQFDTNNAGFTFVNECLVDNFDWVIQV